MKLETRHSDCTVSLFEEVSATSRIHGSSDKFISVKRGSGSRRGGRIVFEFGIVSFSLREETEPSFEALDQV